MTIYQTQARSYAKAIFDLALPQQKLGEWQESLKMLAQIALACKESDILENPQVQGKQKITLFAGVIDELPEALNLLKLLAQRKKLSILPEIASSYQQLFFTHTKTLEVKVVSVEELTASQKEQLFGALKRRHQCEILLRYQIDDKLIGGAIIYVADKVIDGSISGILQRLKQNLLLKNSYAKT